MYVHSKLCSAADFADELQSWNFHGRLAHDLFYPCTLCTSISKEWREACPRTASSSNDCRLNCTPHRIFLVCLDLFTFHNLDTSSLLDHADRNGMLGRLLAGDELHNRLLRLLCELSDSDKHIHPKHRWRGISIIRDRYVSRKAPYGAQTLVDLKIRYHSLGVPWATSLLGFICVAFLPAPFLFYKYGHKLRAKSRFIPTG